MEFSTWVTLFTFTIFLCLSPGPTMFTVITQSLQHGKRSIAPLLAGVLAGDLFSMTLSFMGLGALLAASTQLFVAFKWLAAAYLIYLGIKAWRNKEGFSESNCVNVKRSAMFRDTFMVTALNPKSVMFYVAFFPIFLNIDAPIAPQILIIGTTMLVLSGVSTLIYAASAGLFRNAVKKPKVGRLVNKTTGGFMIGIGAMVALSDK